MLISQETSLARFAVAFVKRAGRQVSPGKTPPKGRGRLLRVLEPMTCFG